MKHNKSAETAILLAVFVILLYLPFSNKAFHIDDIAFINLSKLIGWNPVKANHTNYNYFGITIENFLPFESTHPLLVPYYIKLIIHLFKENEFILHIFFSVFFIASIISLHKLNYNIFKNESSTSILLIICFISLPVFLVNSHNIMTDVPTLAFMLASLASYTKFCSDDSIYNVYVGGICLTFSIFCSYHIILVTPILFIYILIKKRMSRHAFISLLLPIISMAIWMVCIYEQYDIFPLLKSNLDSSKTSIASEIIKGSDFVVFVKKNIFNIAYIGSSIFISLIIYAISTNKSLQILYLNLVVLPYVYFILLFLNDYSRIERLFLSIFVSIGITSFITITKIVISNINIKYNIEEHIFLFAWIIIIFLVNIFIFPFGSSRYLLSSIPPLLIILFNNINFDTLSNTKKTITIVMVIFSIIFGLTAAISDYQLASKYRSFANDIKNEIYLSKPNNFWYIGEWGMRYYMEKSGAMYLLCSSNQPQAGDYILTSEMSQLWAPSKQLTNRLTIVATRKYSSPLPIRLFNRRSNAGFYSHHWGLLPFSVSSEPDEVFTILKVVQ